MLINAKIMYGVLGKYTILIVAHRLSTIKTSDKIYVLDKGRVLDSGSYSDLLETSTRFKKMIRLQEL